MYIVEGNIGAGKSTLLKLIEQREPTIAIALEPLHNWHTNAQGQSLLANFYQNPQRWALTLELFAMICRVQEHVHDQNNPNPARLMERSIYSGHYCFARNGYQQKFINDIEWAVYNQWFTFLTTACKPPHGFIYLKIDPELAYDRITQRNRSGENNITLDYLRHIHELHEQFLVHKKAIAPELQALPVLVLDGNADFEHDKKIGASYCSQIRDFILMTQPHRQNNYKSFELT